MSVVKSIKNHPVTFGGEEHSGWLPAGAAVPPPIPLEHYVLDAEIVEEGSGYLLVWNTQDGSCSGDAWHQSLEDAVESASHHFGARPDDWGSA